MNILGAPKKGGAIRDSRTDVLFGIVNGLLSALIVLIMLFPLYFIVIASISDPYSVAKGQVFFWPKGFTLDAYAQVFNNSSIWTGYQLALRFAQYHLEGMVKKDNARVGIGAKGLTGEGYKGHSFWDTEIFLSPYYLLTEPSAAKTLLEYRFNTIGGAYQKAKEYGYQGAMYPWESAWIDDGEVTPKLGIANIVTGEPMPVLTGMIEHHVTAAVAYAAQQYFCATGDQEFMDRCGYEIITQTARFWASRATWNEQLARYDIPDVIGPDEYKVHVDNNAYTNYMAWLNMTHALKLTESLKRDRLGFYQVLDARLDLEDTRREIEQVAPKLYLPVPNEEGIIPQFDGFEELKQLDLEKYKNSGTVRTIFRDYSMNQLRHLKVCKQADLLVLFFLMDDLFSADIKRRNYFFTSRARCMTPP